MNSYTHTHNGHDERPPRPLSRQGRPRPPRGTHRPRRPQRAAGPGQRQAARPRVRRRPAGQRHAALQGRPARRPEALLGAVVGVLRAHPHP